MIIKVDLSSESVRDALKQVQTYKRSFTQKLDELCRRLAEEGVKAAVSEVRIDTGELKESIHYEKHGECEYLVIAHNDHAAFVEFGTGVVGEGKPYPGELPANWEYDTRATPSAHDRLDPTLWYYNDPITGVTMSTRGQKPNAYMVKAGEEMRQSVLEIAKEVFG